jgi:hypothetical protein
MKRIVFLSAAALMSAVAVPAFAQEATEKPPIIQPDGSQSGEAQKSDRMKKGGTEQQGAQKQMPAEEGAKQDDTAQGQMPADQGQTGSTAQQQMPADQGQTGSGQAAQGEDTSGTTKPQESTAGATDQKKPADDTAGATQEQPGVSKETTASVNISTEQKTEIRNVIVEQAKPVDVDFEVNVGVAVPRTVTLATLPTRVVEIVPQYEGYKYFVLADGRIIIVDPNSMEVVYILVV